MSVAEILAHGLVVPEPNIRHPIAPQRLCRHFEYTQKPSRPPRLSGIRDSLLHDLVVQRAARTER